MELLPFYSLTLLTGAASDAVFASLRTAALAPSATEAAEAYCRTAGKLLEEGLTLAEYLERLVRFDDNAFLRAVAAGDVSHALQEAFAHDIAMLREITHTAEGLREDLAARFPAHAAHFLALPALPAGAWCASAQDFEQFARTNGFGRFAASNAFTFDGTLHPVLHPDPIRLTDLKGYAVQKRRILENTKAFLDGHPANNALLYGDRGTGKSSTVKALLNEYASRGLRMVQMGKEHLPLLGALIEELAPLPLRFIVFIDDLTFQENDDSFGALKAVLEGSLVSRPRNLLIYATTNRRHLIKETFTAREGSELHRADTIDETLSLSDRFGLYVTFLMPGKDEFLTIVKALAEDRGLITDEDALFAGAERFALAKSSRTPRLARQYIDAITPRILRGESLDQL